jgi:hypothetical protein
MGLIPKGTKNVLLIASRAPCTSGMVGFGQKIFSYFCYLIHEKCSEMCVWIVRFSQKRLFLGKKTLQKVPI